MTIESDAAVGRLSVMDGVLNDLLRELVTETIGRDAEGLTTGKAAQILLGHAKRDTALLTPDVTDWLKRVDQAAQARNKIMHAVARDQCVHCGNATRFEHKGQPVDRSAETVAAVAYEYHDLIDEGARHARTISEALNDHAQAKAENEAAKSGQIQSPRQILIGQNFSRCENCSRGGNPIAVVALPTAAAVLPPGMSLPGLGLPNLKVTEAP
jgi:glutaredoxin